MGETLADCVAEGLPPTPVGYGRLRDRDRASGLPPEMPGRINRRTATVLTGPDSKASLTDERRGALGDSRLNYPSRASAASAGRIRQGDALESLSMNEAIAFDTHRFVKNLTAHGFSEEQAEALATEQVNLLNSNLATKADIAEVQREIEVLRQETKVEIAGVRREIEALKVDLLKWLFAAMFAQVGLIVTLLKLL